MILPACISLVDGEPPDSPPCWLLYSSDSPPLLLTLRDLKDFLECLGEHIDLRR